MVQSEISWSAVRRTGWVLFLAIVAVLPFTARADPSSPPAGDPALAAVVRDPAGGWSDLLPFYEARGFRPVWLERDGPGDRGRVLLDRLAAVAREGLEPADYGVAAIADGLAAPQPGPWRAELLLSRGLRRYGRDMGAGDVLAAAAGSDDLTAFLDRLAPPDAAYGDLRAALARYRAVAAGGGWRPVPDGPLIRPGETDGRLPALRRRLAATGDLADDPAEGGTAGDAYDPCLADALRRFQARHGLAADGVVGPLTLAALNLPAAERVAILAENLRRLRAHLRQVRSTAVVVNLAAADLRALVDGVQVLRSRVIVGREDWATPVFQGTITALEFHPYWNVPPRIVRLEMLPRIRRDPDYLARQDIRVIDGWRENAPQIDPATIDWRAAGAAALRLRQQPGPRNPLGRVKFLFANPYQVYLHDTPRTDLFSRAKRALSHGCVRVERAAELAAVLLAPDPAWPPEAVAAALDRGQTQRVRLVRPMPLYLVNLTAWAEPDGTVHFRPHGDALGGGHGACGGTLGGTLPAKAPD